MKRIAGRESAEQAKRCAVRLLKYRPRSEKEIRDRLSAQGFSDTLVERSVEIFKARGMIDDRMFALWWARSRLKKPFGMRRIGAELHQKGVSHDVIHDVLATELDDYCEEDAVQEAAKHRVATYAYLSPEAARRRLCGYLLRRGFGEAAVIKTVESLINT